ncbi:MAG: hypothetical protein WEA54_05370 [Actinomycetota bacterium]
MTTRSELEQLPPDELADRALSLARHRLDVRFLWGLVRTIPEAEVAAGNMEESKADVMWLSALLNDLGRADAGDLAEALRPYYLDYLDKHEKVPPASPGTDPNDPAAD